MWYLLFYFEFFKVGPNDCAQGVAAWFSVVEGMCKDLGAADSISWRPIGNFIIPLIVDPNHLESGVVMEYASQSTCSDGVTRNGIQIINQCNPTVEFAPTSLTVISNLLIFS